MVSSHQLFSKTSSLARCEKTCWTGSFGIQIPRDICTRFRRYLYSMKLSWIIIPVIMFSLWNLSPQFTFIDKQHHITIWLIGNEPMFANQLNDMVSMKFQSVLCSLFGTSCHNVNSLKPGKLHQHFMANVWMAGTNQRASLRPRSVDGSKPMNHLGP